MSETLQTTLSEFEKGDEITFNDRVQPLTVTRVYESDTSSGYVRVYVEGPRGGSYRLAADDSELRDSRVSRDLSKYDHNTEWGDEEELESVRLETPAAEVEPPVEIGDEFKKTTTLDCVSYTGESWGYRVVGIDRETQTITLEIAAVAPSADPDEWKDEIEIDYQELADRLSRRWESVDSLEDDPDVELGDEDDDEPDPGVCVATDGGRWEPTEPVGLDKYVPLDMSNNIEDERVKARISWVDGFGRAYADALDLEDDDPDRGEGVATDGGSAYVEARVRCLSCGETKLRSIAYSYDAGDLALLECFRCRDDRDHRVESADLDRGERLATDGGFEISPTEHFAAYVGGLVCLDARAIDGRVVGIKATLGAVEDARSELDSRGYRTRLESEDPEDARLLVYPTVRDVDAVLEAIEHGIPAPGESLDVEDPADRYVEEDEATDEDVADAVEGVDLDQGEGIETDGGFVEPDEAAEWCPRCQRYRLSCSHGPITPDGGVDTTNMSRDPVSGMVDYERRAEELAEETALTPGEAKVAALKERGLSHSAIADELGLTKSTVDENSRRINRRCREARRTLEELDPALDRGEGVETDGGTSTYSDEDLELADDLAHSLTVDYYDAVEREGLRAEYNTDRGVMVADSEEIRVYPVGGGSPPITYDRDAVERAGSSREVRRARVDS